MAVSSAKECDTGAFEFDPIRQRHADSRDATYRNLHAPADQHAVANTKHDTHRNDDTTRRDADPDAQHQRPPARQGQAQPPTATATRPPNLDYSIYLPMARSDLPYLPGR